MSSGPGDIIGYFTTFEGLPPRRFKCSQFRKATLDFNFECIKLLQNDFCKQRYITLDTINPGQDRIYSKTYLCRTSFAEYIMSHDIKKNFAANAPIKVADQGCSAPLFFIALILESLYF